MEMAQNNTYRESNAMATDKTKIYTSSHVNALIKATLENNQADRCGVVLPRRRQFR